MVWRDYAQKKTALGGRFDSLAVKAALHQALRRLMVMILHSVLVTDYLAVQLVD